MSSSSGTLSNMRADRRESIALARSHRPQVARPCEDKRLMQNGKMAHDQLSKHRAALLEAVSKKDKKKAAAIQQTIHAMENSQIYLQYRDCQDAMKTYGASNPMEAARLRDRHVRMNTGIANREKQSEMFPLGGGKRTRRRKSKGGSHCSSHKRKHKSNTQARSRKRKSKGGSHCSSHKRKHKSNTQMRRSKSTRRR